jgi:hypothetical protein
VGDCDKVVGAKRAIKKQMILEEYRREWRDFVSGDAVKPTMSDLKISDDEDFARGELITMDAQAGG